MSAFSKRFPGISAGEYREIGTPWHAVRALPDNVSVRTFVTPSHTFPDEGYYLQAVKGRKAGPRAGRADAVSCGIKGACGLCWRQHPSHGPLCCKTSVRICPAGESHWRS